MIRSFITITLRILWRNKVTSFVNIFSLSIGITSFILIMLYVHHETSYDKFNENYDRIYRLEGDDYTKLPPSIADLVDDRLPEVKKVTRFAGASMVGGTESYISYAPESNPENIIQVAAMSFWAESTIFDVFTFSFIQGDVQTALIHPMTTVLTQSIAKKLFGDIDPMLKTVEWNNHSYQVTGIINDVKNSHIEIDALFSFESIPKVIPNININITANSSWLWSATYLLMENEIDQKIIERKINKVLAEINNGNVFDLKFEHFHIRPLKNIYFDGALPKLAYGLHGNVKLIRILIALGTFLLVLACINYVNLSTARSIIRAKEIAVKRISGSSAIQLRYQLVVESIIVSLISLIVAMTIVQLFMSRFSALVMVDIQGDEFNRPARLFGVFGGTIFLGIIAGLYPAFYLTVIQPIRLIKGVGINDANRSSFRSTLMIFQFTLSIVMIVAIIVNFRQLHYVRNAELGFDKEQIITLITPDGTPNERVLRETFRERLIQYPDIVNASFYVPGQVPTGLFDSDGNKRVMNAAFIDPNFLDVRGIQITEGRGFSHDHPADKMGPSGPIRVLINESAAQEFDFDSVLGKSFSLLNGRRAEIIGIVKDFHFRSLHHKIEPLLFWWNPSMIVADIKINSTDIPKTLNTIEAEWKNVWGSKPFEYRFLDQIIDQQYKSDEQVATVIGYFTVLAVIIACLGLFALSSFVVSRRIKEIGVRKTMGASVSAIYSMLSWDFLKCVLLAVVIGSPIGWYFMKLWLDTFAYHIKLSVDIFILTALLALAIALLTITWQALKAANANPIKSLRYE